MQTLSLSQCKEYIKNVKDLEISCLQQERLLQELNRQSSVTKKRISDLENRLLTEKGPKKPESPVSLFFTSLIVDVYISFFGAIVGAVGAIILRVLLLIFSSNIGLFSPPWAPYLLWGAVIGFAITFLLSEFCWSKNDRREEKRKRESYPDQVESFQNEKQEIRNLIEVKKKTLQTDIPREIAVSEEKYRQTREVLKKYYDMGFIYPKYRGLVPICTLYEYLESGRCFSLLGHEGAYNLYESELRLNVIIGKLDDVLDRLDDINTSQRLLAQEIRRSNAQLNRIIGTLDNIEKNTALTQYYSSVTASNTTFMSWLAALNYDDQKRKR